MENGWNVSSINDFFCLSDAAKNWWQGRVGLHVRWRIGRRTSRRLRQEKHVHWLVSLSRSTLQHLSNLSDVPIKDDIIWNNVTLRLHRSDDSGDEIDDQEVNKILIITQTPPAFRKHPGGDRTGDHVPRYKIIFFGRWIHVRNQWTAMSHSSRWEKQGWTKAVRQKHWPQWPNNTTVFSGNTSFCSASEQFVLQIQNHRWTRQSDQWWSVLLWARSRWARSSGEYLLIQKSKEAEFPMPHVLRQHTAEVSGWHVFVDVGHEIWVQQQCVLLARWLQTKTFIWMRVTIAQSEKLIFVGW